MRAFVMRVTAVAVTVVLGAGPMLAPAQDQAIMQPGARPRPMQQGVPAQPAPGQETIPGRIVIPRLVDLTPPLFHIPPQPTRSMEQAPAPERYIAPGIEGVYAQLRQSKTRYKEVKLNPYEPYRSPVTPPDASRFNLRQVVVKFVEGSGVRLREDRLVVSEEPAAVETRPRLGRSGLEPSMLAADLGRFNDGLASVRALVDRATPIVDELDLQRLRQAAERSTRFEQPDLNLFYFILLPAMPPEDAARFLQQLQRLRSVEVAYFQPIPHDAADKPPTTTLNVTPAQGYLRRAPQGIDVDFARNFTGGRGQNVRIVDVESGWNIDHEDLPQLFYRTGTNFGGDHGTAVLGELVAADNGFGATGIVPNALAGWSSVSGGNWRNGQIYFYSVGSALVTSLEALRAGDIALIEQHFPSNVGPPPNRCNPGQFGFVAVESVPMEHAAITHLTGAGVIVVEAAGNGQQLVVPASTRDSGAIVVGASNGGNAGNNFGAGANGRAPACFTNFGPRVDLHAWGGGVGTLGMGQEFFLRRDVNGNPVLDTDGMPIFDLLVDPTLRGNGNDEDQWYTRIFSGTSSASPIVTGAAALVQSIRIAYGHAPLTPVQMRSVLAATGTPQTADAKNIGPLPNVRAALATMFPDHAQFMFQSSTSVAQPIPPGATFNVTVRFRNAGGVPWTGGHVMEIAPTNTGPSAFTAPPIAQGTSSAPIDPNGLATSTFTVRAPMTNGSHPLSFQLRAPTGAIMANSPAQQIIVGAPPSDTATITYINAPSQLRVGVPGLVQLYAVNTGATMWMPVTHALRIWGPANVSFSHASINVPQPVPPGGMATFMFQVTCRAPASITGYSTQMSSGATVGPVAGRTLTCTQ